MGHIPSIPWGSDAPVNKDPPRYGVVYVLFYRIKSASFIHAWKKSPGFLWGVRLGAYVAVAACFSVKYIIILLLIDDVKFLEIAIWMPLSRKFIGKFSWLKLGFKNEMKILRKHLALKSFWLVWCTWNFSVYNFGVW